MHSLLLLYLGFPGFEPRAFLLWRQALVLCLVLPDSKAIRTACALLASMNFQWANIEERARVSTYAATIPLTDHRRHSYELTLFSTTPAQELAIPIASARVCLLEKKLHILCLNRISRGTVCPSDGLKKQSIVESVSILCVGRLE